MRFSPRIIHPTLLGVALVATGCFKPSPYDEDADGDGWVAAYDCDDTNASVNIRAEEVPYNGLDDDCNEDTPDDDLDGDGFVNGDDCDDADRSTYPGANEACDGVDNDCDNTIDEEAGPTWYPDDDDDGYGDVGGVGVVDCEAPEGYVNDNTDCHDGDQTINPGEDELCFDSVDNDCDGETDEDDALDAATWYPDVDEDGYGDGTAEGVQQCEELSGSADNGDDCNDGDDAVNPDADEVCDAVDNDCDGTADNDADVLGDAAACAADDCLDLLSRRGGSPDGEYYIDPAGGSPFVAYCDMTTDGGGYTFYKMDDPAANASDAEAACASMGMSLFVPRTEAHLLSAYDIATNDGIGPEATDEYLGILGIYLSSTATDGDCSNTAFNSVDCTEWAASDDNAYWVTDRTDIGEPDGDASADESMQYTWSSDGTVDTYQDVTAAGGATSDHYFCDTLSKP